MTYNEGWFREDIHYDELSVAEIAQLELDYQSAFSTPSGIRVLNHLLAELGFFRETRTDEDVILQNFSKRIIRNIGIWKEGNSPSIISKILELRGVTTDGSKNIRGTKDRRTPGERTRTPGKRA